MLWEENFQVGLGVRMVSSSRNFMHQVPNMIWDLQLRKCLIISLVIKMGRGLALTSIERTESCNPTHPSKLQQRKTGHVHRRPLHAPHALSFLPRSWSMSLRSSRSLRPCKM